MRDHSKHIQLSREEAISSLLEGLRKEGFRQKAQQSLEHVALGDAFGRVLAQDIVAKTDLPNVLTCCLDSVALHWSDFASLPEGEIPDTSSWKRGVDWQFANTGIAMPEGFDTAIVIESVEVSDDEEHIKILVAPSEQYAGTRQPGSNKKKGDLIVKSGRVITPDIAASISGAGYSSVLVERKPRVSFLPTGNELVPANLPYSNSAPNFYAGYGHVFESNSVLTKGRIEQWGGVFAPFDITPDEYDVIKATILEAVRTSDIVVLNAGSSKGSDDWSVEVLDEIGSMVFHQVSHGPGHHSFAAIVDGTPVVGISGPPGGVTFTLGFYLRPLIYEWLGLNVEPDKVSAKLVGSFGENKFARKKIQSKRAGEDRPAEATEPGAKFSSVRFVRLDMEDDGVLTATPIDRSEISTTTAPTAIYMLDAGPDDVFPVEGDTIFVELR